MKKTKPNITRIHQSEEMYYNTNTHTHTPFVRNYPGEPVPER